MKRYIVKTRRASVKASNEPLAPYKMVGRGADGREVRIGGQDEDECMYKLNQWAEAHGGLEWYSGLTDDNYRDGERIVESVVTAGRSTWLSKQSADQFRAAKKETGLYTRTETAYQYYMRKRDEIPHKYNIGDVVKHGFPDFIGEIVDVQFLPESLARANENFAWRYLLKVIDPCGTTCKPGEIYDFAAAEYELKPLSDSERAAVTTARTNTIRRH